MPFALASPPVAGAAPPAGGSWRRPASLLLAVLLLAWAVRSFLVTPFSIPSASMAPTLRSGDYVLAAKWPYGYSRVSFPFDFPPIAGRLLGRLPERGDVIVFRAGAGRGHYIKRVIGLPGDRVALHGDRLVLNGRAASRRPLGAAGDPRLGERLPGGPAYAILDGPGGALADFGPALVPAGHLFLLGDNRDNSFDSRMAVAAGGIGFVPIANVVGRADRIIWSGGEGRIGALRWGPIGEGGRR